MSNQQHPQIEPDDQLTQSLDRLRQEIVGALLYCHHRENSNTTKTLEVSAFAYALIELLVEKGLLTEEELNERKQEAGKRLVEKFTGSGMGAEIQESKIDKYDFDESPRIDCENRVHLCKAACCRLRFPLSRQDIEEGVVKWDLAHPYLIARREDGYCNHLDTEQSQCTVYEHRPLPCRAYDCRNDARIWANFDESIASPELEKLFQQ
jgi:hypothetical protein